MDQHTGGKLLIHGNKRHKDSQFQTWNSLPVEYPNQVNTVLLEVVGIHQHAILQTIPSLYFLLDSMKPHFTTGGSHIASVDMTDR